MKRRQCYDIKCTDAVVLEAVRGVVVKIDTGQVDSSHTGRASPQMILE